MLVVAQVTDPATILTIYNHDDHRTSRPGSVEMSYFVGKTSKEAFVSKNLLRGHSKPSLGNSS